MTAWSEPDFDPVALHRPPRRRRTWPQRLLLSLSMLLVLALVMAALGLTWGLRRYQSINFLNVPGVEGAASGEPTNWLLVGSDSREGIEASDPNAAVFIGEEVAGKRTDTIIIARVDPSRKSIDLLSVPRDLWVPIAGTGSNGRINSAFNGDGGEERLVSTVESFLDIEINNYVEVNFVGFQAVIDALGGVPIWFDSPVRDVKSGLMVESPGCHTLTGFDALAFARSRSLEYQEGGSWRSDPTGDLGRTARQQYLLSRLADTASARLDVTDIGTIDSILRAGGENLVLDDGAGASDLLSLARTFGSVGSAGISRHALPVTGFRTSGGAAVLALEEQQAQPTLELFRGTGQLSTDPDAQVARDSFIVDVENGARISGIAAAAAADLGAAGFVIGGIGNSSTVDSTVIRYPSAQQSAAATTGAALAEAPRYEVDDSLTNVLLVIGPGYGGLVTGPTAETTPTEVVPDVPAAQAPGENEVGVVPGQGPAGTECAG